MSAPAIRHPGELRWETRALTLVVAVLVVFGLAEVYGAASFVTSRSGANLGLNYALKQLMGAVLGALLLAWAARTDYHRWRDWAWPMLGGAALLLLIPLLPFTHAISPTLNGARRWIRLGPLSMQPSEVARVVVVMWCAMLAAKKGAQVRNFKKGVVPFLVGIGFIALLILLEPNLSMATLVALLGCTVLFTAGAKIGHFMLLGFGGLLVVWHKIASTGFRSERMKVFLNADAASDAAFQIHNSLVGIGSGRLVGVGFGEGQQKLGYLPYAYSDFVFSTIAEEWGFVGVCLVVALFTLFCWLGFRIARTAPDAFGQFLAAGLTCTVGITAFMHMAVSLGLMPTTGLTLPFVSYGGSSLVISLVGTGILVNIGRLRGKPVRDDG
ncbi:MAG TPA: putative peptidoglycan glycosyltransferase FtsW [Gemmatimonadales bacterium]|nr:putative peptidoglycan glycosyltransferase FtsW [Gemmatimonadales bacterium]